MENMKRAISALMALVLVLGMLPGVPMFAGAEEVETQPETQVVETTEAVTVPAETEAPETTEAPVETVPETTAAAETVPEETVPETTAAPETVPEETVSGETVPEETVTVEIGEELNASQEAVDGVIENRVTDIQVKASAEKTFVGDKVTLTAKVSPANADIPDVIFYVVEEGSDPISYDEELLEEKGVLMVEEPGTLVLAARATDDGEESHDSATQEEGGTVKVTFVDYTMAINETAIDKDAWYDEDGDEEGDYLRVMTGDSLSLSVHYMVNGTVDLPLLEPNVEWYLADGDEKYATVTVKSGDCREVTVTGKTVTETKYITLFAKEKTIGVVDSISIAVYPIPYKVGIYDAEGEEYTNETLTVSLLSSELEDKEYLKLELTAQVWPLEAEEPMVWTSSDKLVIVEHPDKKKDAEVEEGAEPEKDTEVEEGTEPEKDTTRATIRIYPVTDPDTTVITVSSKNYPDIKSKITIKRKWCLEAENLEFHQETEDLSEKGEGLVAGQSFQLKVYDVRDDKNPELLTSETVKWSLPAEDQDYATISENGKLTARKGITTGKEITVLCSVIDNEDACLKLPVIIRPLATEVRILPGDLAVDDSPRMVSEEILNGKTIAVDTANGRAPFALGVMVMPDDEYGAKQDVTWKSSNTSIATVDNDTDKITWEGKNGTVTITATAADGSGKKATVKLKFGAMVQDISIVQDEGFFLRSGKSWTFDVEFMPKNPTDKGLTWSLVGENDTKYASISASTGKLTAKTVYEEHTVTVRATAKDGSGVYGQTRVTIKPKQDGILTLKKVTGEEKTYVTKTTQTLAVGDTIELEAYILGEESTEYVKWKSSNSKVAQVNQEYGGTTTITILKAGTATITATSQNDTSKKTTVTLKGVRMTDSIEWTHTHKTTELACGKSLTLKAKAYDAEGKTPSISKLAWSIAAGGEKYAKVSSSGKVTAIAGSLTPYDAPVDITVVVAATDGSGVEEEYPFTIYPIAQSVVMDQPADVYINSPTAGTNTFVMTTPGEDTVQMSAQVYSENAIQGVTWKSSNSKVASIDKESGLVTCMKAGTVTITATATDGSGKKATFKLTILQKPVGIYFDMEHFAIAGGKSLKIKPVLVDGNEKKITGKKLEWKVLPIAGMEDGTAYVTSISGGTLKTKKVTAPKYVKVMLRTQEKNEEWEIETEIYVGIYPAASSVTIVDAEGNDIGKTKWAALSSGSLQVDAVVASKTGDDPYQGVTWKSSNKKIAEVDGIGNIIFHKAGTVTITATAADGTTVKDSFKLTIGG